MKNEMLIKIYLLKERRITKLSTNMKLQVKHSEWVLLKDVKKHQQV